MFHGSFSCLSLKIPHKVANYHNLKKKHLCSFQFLLDSLISGFYVDSSNEIIAISFASTKKTPISTFKETSCHHLYFCLM